MFSDNGLQIILVIIPVVGGIYTAYKGGQSSVDVAKVNKDANTDSAQEVYVTEMKQIIENYRDERAEMRKEREELRREKEELEKILDEVKKTNLQLQQENKSLREEIVELKERIKKKDGLIDNLTKKIEEMEGANA